MEMSEQQKLQSLTGLRTMEKFLCKWVNVVNETIVTLNYDKDEKIPVFELYRGKDIIKDDDKVRKLYYDEIGIQIEGIKNHHPVKEKAL